MNPDVNPDLTMAPANVPAHCVVGIDIGTSGVRTAVLNRQQELIAGGERCAFSDLDGHPGDPQIWWKAVEQTLQATCARLAVSGHAVVAVCVDGTSGTLLPIDRDGRPLARPLMYSDTVNDAALLQSIARHMPADSAAGGASSGLAKAMVFASLGPARIVHQADWIAGSLMGRFDFSDANNALKTGYDAINDEWPDWLDLTGLDRSLLPEVKRPGNGMASLSQGMAERFGLSASVQVIAGTTDGCAAFLATGASEPGDAVTSLGSTITVKVLSDEPVYAPEYGVYSHRIGEQWLAGGASNSGGRVLARFFSDEQLRSLSAQIDLSRSCELDYYPLLSRGERFPVNDPQLEPRLTPRPDSDIEFLYGLLWGMTGIEALGYRRLVENGAPPLRSMRSVGGGAGNACWTALREARLGIPFLATRSTEAAAGAARLACIGATEMKLW